MPEPAAWKYQKITKPMFDAQTCGAHVCPRPCYHLRRG